MQRAYAVQSCPAGHPLELFMPTLGAEDEPSWPQQLDLAWAAGACSACRRIYRVERDGYWLDAARGIFVLVLRPSLQPQWSSLEGQVQAKLLQVCRAQRVMVDGLSRIRLVFGMAALQQKLALWEAGFDDRLLEVIRLQAFQRQAAVVGPNVRVPPVLQQIELGRARMTLHWPHVVEAKGKVIHLPLQQYELLAAQRAALEKQLPALFTRPYVDVLRLFGAGPRASST